MFKYDNTNTLYLNKIIKNSHFQKNGYLLKLSSKHEIMMHIKKYLLGEIKDDRPNLVNNKSGVNTEDLLQLSKPSTSGQSKKRNRKSENDTTKLNIMHLNIQCLRNKTLLIEKFIDDNKKTKTESQFICITEHWLNELEIDVLTIKNYLAIAFSVRSVFKRGAP